MNRRDLTSDTVQDKFDVEAAARRHGVEPYQVRATGAVGDALMRDLVSDFRGQRPQSGSMISRRPGSSEPDPKSAETDGWVDAAPLLPRRGRWVETDPRIAAQQAAVDAEIERRLDRNRRDPYNAATEYNPFDKKRLGHDDDE